MYVEDAAAAVLKFLRVMETEDTIGTIHPTYNVGISKGISIADLADMIRNAVGWQGNFEYDHARPDGAIKKLLDGTRFQLLTGWEPRTSLAEGVARTVDWYQRTYAEEPAYAG